MVDIHKTSKGRQVEHLHRLTKEPDLNAVDLAIYRGIMADRFPQAEIVKDATIKYNCHGFALAPTHEGWYNVPDFFLSDDFDGTSMASPQPGDIVIYGNNGIVAHSAVVIEVSDNKIVRLQSKWGGVNEVKHPVSHVPEVYGEPIVLLRRQPGVPQHPAVSGVFDVAVTVDKGEVEDSSDKLAADAPSPETEAADIGTAETESSHKKIPDSFMLMLASTPEVERQIRRSIESRQSSSVGPFRAPSSAVDNSEADAAAPLETSSASEDSLAEHEQDEIGSALAELSSPITQFELLLASTPQVLREAASRLRPIKDLIELDKTKPETRKAIVEFFDKPGTQADEEITGLTLFLLSKLPSKEAVAAVARYLQAGNFSPFNGGLAIDALKAAVALPT